MHLHSAGGLFLSPAHYLLSLTNRLIAFEMPGFGHSAPNNQETMDELAATMGRAITNLGIDTFNLWGTSFGGKTALTLALQAPERVQALVLEAPAAIRPDEAAPPAVDDPEALMRAFHAHPERFASAPTPDPEVQARTWPMVMRLIGPNRDHAFEERLKALSVPVLVLFGTHDGVIPPEMGRIYKSLLPNCHFVLIYDAAHALTDDRPEAFTEVVSDFLERHEQFAVSRRSTVIYP
ncbi:alpha/beta fold hydrolase [Thermogemmatispora carboxidivorans]|uniref:alpha/beta fold hydrolase n=1 Tax=Thermogemmatispora carboxidivorans TaxID=1382306 RepID=UPI00138DE430|nr:alpha/beta hydrolase [Thermogemmatispora carboxidivorans]